MLDDINENLTDKNFLLYAAKAYIKPNAIMSEFDEDLQRIKYIKRLFRKYKATKDIKERLILNHIICLGNVFGVPVATKLLFFKIDNQDYDTLKTFLLALDYMPDMVYGIDGINIKEADIPVDLNLASKLRRI